MPIARLKYMEMDSACLPKFLRNMKEIFDEKKRPTLPYKHTHKRLRFRF